MEEMIEGLMSKCGLSKEQADSVFKFLKDNASKVPEWIASSGIASKLPGGLGGMLSGLGGGSKDDD